MSTSKNYLGQNVLVSYFKEREKRSYRGFLALHRDVIVASSALSNNWKDLDRNWVFNYLKEAEKLLDFTSIKEKVKSERSEKWLKPYWQGVIEEQKKDSIKRKRAVRKCLKSIITLICLVKGNAPTNAFAIDIDSEKLISHLKDAIKVKKAPEFDDFSANKLKLWKVKISDDQDDQLRNHSLQVQDELLATRKISKYFITTPVKEHVHVIVVSPADSFTEHWSRILEQKKDKVVFRKVVDDAFCIALAYENLIAGNVVPFTKIIKTFLSTRSHMSLSSANEPVLQAIVESLLPSRYHVPELLLVMNGTKLKGDGRFGFSDVFVLNETGENNVCLELKYVSLVGLMRENKNIGANSLKKLDQALEKEDERSLLIKPYTYWSKKNRKENWTTIGEILDGGMNQLKSYMNIISNGKPKKYSDSGLFDDRIRITTSDPPNKIQGFVILVIGFRSILWRRITNIPSKYKYSKI